MADKKQKEDEKGKEKEDVTKLPRVIPVVIVPRDFNFKTPVNPIDVPVVGKVGADGKITFHPGGEETLKNLGSEEGDDGKQS